MCTVSFISVNNKFIITSNRDEHTSRPVAFVPKEETLNNCKVIYPKDPKAGGTWFAINENGVAAVLLNGAFQKHTSTGAYAISRGLVLLNIITNPTPAFHFSNMDLKNIEPFTLILFENHKLLELRWDGMNKHRKELNTENNYIWSSATLYSKDVIKHRENLFSDFILNETTIDEGTIINFHSNNNDDFENGFIINRNNKLKTFSITQAVFNQDEIILNHHDLLNKENYSLAVNHNHFFNQLQ